MIPGSKTMAIPNTALLATAATLSLTACGGSGGGVASIPVPPVVPTPTPTPSPTPTTPANYMIAANVGGQTFASKGGYVSFNPATGAPVSPTTTEGEQLRVRY